MTETELKLEYADRTRYVIDLPESFELALEADYVINSRLYTDESISTIQLMYEIAPNITPEIMMIFVHNLHT